MKDKNKKSPKTLLDFIEHKSLATGICVLDDYRSGKFTIKQILHIYKNHP